MVDKTGVVDGFTRVTEAPECQKFCWGTSLCSGHNLPPTPLQGPDWNIIGLSAPKLSPHVPKLGLYRTSLSGPDVRQIFKVRTHQKPDVLLPGRRTFIT